MLKRTDVCVGCVCAVAPSRSSRRVVSWSIKLKAQSSKLKLNLNQRLFPQGPETDQAKVAAIRAGIAEGVDTSICLLNYKADGTPFWNQVRHTSVLGRDRHDAACLVA